MENEKVQEIAQKILDQIPDEQKEKALECETLEDLVNLAGETGAELPDELMDEVGGGFAFGALISAKDLVYRGGALFSKPVFTGGQVLGGDLVQRTVKVQGQATKITTTTDRKNLFSGESKDKFTKA